MLRIAEASVQFAQAVTQERPHGLAQSWWASREEWLEENLSLTLEND